MKIAVLSLALVAAHITTPVSDRMPELNVDALCKARSADAKIMKFTEARNVADCVRDEKDARQHKRRFEGGDRSPASNPDLQKALLDGLRDLGYVEGQEPCNRVQVHTRSPSCATAPRSIN